MIFGALRCESPVVARFLYADHSRFLLKWFFICTLLGRGSSGLQCHECSEQFKDRWEPLACQLNASLVPVRECLAEQTYCFVERVTVKGIVTSISRDCTEDCYYGCVASGFGITSLTCTTCCNSDRCNTMNGALTLQGFSWTLILLVKTVLIMYNV